MQLLDRFINNLLFSLKTEKKKKWEPAKSKAGFVVGNHKENVKSKQISYSDLL